ncbi:molybdopterin-dependent oxidoreductase [Shewanella eurypsychrophilus]|uniref:Molybdopterin-dependent oxidoreductase n=1 Tax=Shewanella eurypsychrophilus TaxID=2593656 RepID=A0ABX6VDV6_9GAMM|nr:MULTISPECIES: molybdopterin cofactor-binding domain-containing protein [Shewanella]QFU24870.1 molybdopterin-dependent oxidoreductase [Shewanella sp. YLB-09]QPG60057.1 molybdopterin-dependent oxidoreductase [Shewanella eurypsychrophilus]
MVNFNQIGQGIKRADGFAKVSGRAKYGKDIKLPGMLYGVCRYVDIPAGKVKSIDLSAALNVAGVVRIADFDDIPGDPFAGVIIRDYPPIIKDEVRFMGDVVAIVAAESYEAACEASDLIKVEYEVYKPLSTITEALSAGARLIQPGSESNVVAHHHTAKGNLIHGFAKSDHIIERQYKIGFQEHAYIEPESVTAYIDPTSSNMVVTGSIQNPHRVRGFVASYLGVNQAQVNVKRAVMGGSFGGKDDSIDHLSCRVALMAQLTGRPVQFNYTREQSIVETSKRHPYEMTYKVGFNSDGKIQAIQINILADSGAYAACTPFVTWRSAVQAAGPYEIEHVRVDVTGVYTNNTYTGAMRGFGSPQIVYANESLMDEIAEHCHISAVEVRKINALKQGSVSITGQKFDNHKVSAVEVLEKAVLESDYDNKVKQYQKLNTLNSEIKYGVGLALSYRGCSMGAEGVDTSSALVSVNSDGSVSISTGVCENGQGLQATMSLIAAEVFGIPVGSVTFTEPDTSMISDGGPTVASRATMTGGNAVKDGAETIRSRIFAVIADSLQVTDIDETTWCNGLISNRQRPELCISFAKAVDQTKWAGVNLAAYGWFDQPDITWDEESGSGNPYFTWVYGCQVIEVKVDTNTGKLELVDVTAVHDVGQVINRVGFEGQVSGGIAQAFGLGVLEDYNIAYGELKSENFDSYLLPTIKDIPRINIHSIENSDDGGPFGAKSIGEPCTELGAAAINNAASFALNKRFYQLPLTLEQITLGFNLKKPARQSELLDSSSLKKQTHRLSNTNVTTPRSLAEALASLADASLIPLAGGTDILVRGRLHTKSYNLLNISALAELKGITLVNDQVIIGGGANFNEIVENGIIAETFPIFWEACKTVGSNQIRNRATIGGNLINAAPCAESIPPLLIYNALVELQSATETRRFPISEFICGSYKTLIKPGELLTKVILPIDNIPNALHKYRQLGRRNAVNISRLSLACVLSLNEKNQVDLIRIADGALFSHPRRLVELERYLLGRQLTAENLAETERQLLDMIETAIGGRWSAQYKQPVFINMFRSVMREIVTELAGDDHEHE